MSLLSRNIKLLVCDMAGTTVNEGGIVYIALRSAMNKHGLGVTLDEMEPWHGIQKSEVMEHFLTQRGAKPDLMGKIETSFDEELQEAYFSSDAKLSFIDPKLPEYFHELRSNGIKVALNTGYPSTIQNGILDKLGMREHVDVYTCAYNVSAGRPSPYMVFQLMEMTNTRNVAQVCKAGDTLADIGEGRNSGCGLVVGVTSGADTEKQLLASGADLVVPNVTHIPLFGDTPKLKANGTPDKRYRTRQA